MVLWILLLVLMIPLLSIVLDSQVGKALASRLERQPLRGGDPATHERIAFLEGEVERLGRELERLEEESEFMHRLLTDPDSDANRRLGRGRDGESRDPA